MQVILSENLRNASLFAQLSIFIKKQIFDASVRKEKPQFSILDESRPTRQRLLVDCSEADAKLFISMQNKPHFLRVFEHILHT